MVLSSKRISRSNGGTVSIVVFLVLVGVLMMIPLVYALLQSIKPMEEIFVFPPRFWVNRPTLQNYRNLLNYTSDLWVPVSRYVLNSVFLSVVCTVIQVVIASMAAYSLSKLQWRGRDAFFHIIVLSLLFTGDVVALPQYLMISQMRIIDTFWAMILPSAAYTMGLYLMRQNMLLLPDSLLEAARIDGAPERTIFWSVVMPNVKPTWLTMVVFAFGGLWNRSDTTYIYSEDLKSLPTLLSQISSGGIARAGVSAAAAVLMMIPPILIFIVTQSNVIETMANSGMKE